MDVAFLDDIPEGDVVINDKSGADSWIRLRNRLVEECGQHGPEAVARKHVVEASLARTRAGYGSKDQYTGPVIPDRPEPMGDMCGQTCSHAPSRLVRAAVITSACAITRMKTRRLVAHSTRPTYRMGMRRRRAIAGNKAARTSRTRAVNKGHHPAVCIMATPIRQRARFQARESR